MISTGGPDPLEYQVTTASRCLDGVAVQRPIDAFLHGRNLSRIRKPCF